METFSRVKTSGSKPHPKWDTSDSSEWGKADRRECKSQTLPAAVLERF